MNRRELLKGSFLAAIGLSTSARGRERTAQTGRRLGRIGLQLYTVRRELEKDFEGTLARVAELGFQEVEFAGFFGHHPDEVRPILKRHVLDAPSSHVDTTALADDLERSIAQALEIGNRYLVCAYIRPDERQSLDDYKRFAGLFNEAGEACRKSGIQLCYHNHDFEFAPMGGKIPFDVLLEETDPHLVKIEMDLYWITKGGREPFEYFEAYPGRFPLIHVKDMDATPRRFFTEVGRGIIDFKKIFSRSDQAGVKHYFVEQDETPGSPFDSARISLDYLRSLEL